MKLRHLVWACVIAGGTCIHSARGDERRFTYTYEPETLPAGAFEFENWITLRSQRNVQVGQDNYNRWDLRQEIEYGVSDRYTAALYLNEKAESYRDPITDANESSFEFKGISLENRVNILNPAANKVGFTLYLEGQYSGEEAEIEQKLIFGQRHGAWKWAFNIQHATEWEDNLSEIEGELGASFGLALDLSKRWSIGLELRNHTAIPEYSQVESTALFLGPVISYHHEKFWAALTILPQIYGWNFDGNPDGDERFDLAHHERLEVRLLFGFHF